MIKKNIVVGILLFVTSIAGLYAQEQTSKAEAVLTKKAVTGFIKNHEKLIEGINAFRESDDSKEAQWFETFESVLDEDPNQAAVFLKKNPMPKELSTLCRKYGLDGKTGLLQITVIVYAVLNSEYGAIPFGIHPNDLRLVRKYQTEISHILKPIPVETESDSE